MADNKFSADYAKRVAGCKKCKKKIEKGELRLAKVTASPFSDDGEMKLYHHPACLFETFKRARPSTKIIEDPGDIEGFQELKDEDKDDIRKLIRENPREAKGSPTKKGPKASPTKKGSKASPTKKGPNASPAKKRPNASPAEASPTKKVKKAEKEEEEEEPAKKPETIQVSERPIQGDPKHKDSSFREFRRLCAQIAEEPGYLNKTEFVRRFLSKGSGGKDFKGDLYVWVRLLLPGVVKRIYNLQSKQLIKIFSRIFHTSEEEMLEDLEAGDVAETVAKFFEESEEVSAASKSHLTVHDVDQFLEKLATLTKEDEQQHELTKFIKKCTSNDLKMAVRLIKHDLRIGAGAKHILDGVHKEAYESFNSSRNIAKVIDKILELRKEGNPDGPLDVGCSLMHPVQPMLAMACKSVDMAFEKCPNGMYAEIKYDGERVQLHKQGDQFKYYSRSLKPVLPHKVKPFAEYIPKAFPDGSDLILDAEVLMVDNKTGNPLPFGTLGKHKAAGFKDATPCLFVFDCIYYNGQSLMNKPLSERRKHLTDHMKEAGNHVKFSEMKYIVKKNKLGDMIKDVLKKGLEGLVLKDVQGAYEPGKRHWLKVKKDYLNEGAMADSADLVVLGAWYGTGARGGIMSIFLMGCYDESSKKWCTVTKVHTGVDDATLDRLQGELQPLMTKIKQDPDLVPSWLTCARQMTPDFVAKDPKKSPVWEIVGAEFTKAELHTADGISIRFPRISRFREDKTWQTATSLKHLRDLYNVSKEETDFDIEYSSKDSTKEETDCSKEETNCSTEETSCPKDESAKDVKSEDRSDYGGDTDVDDFDGDDGCARNGESRNVEVKNITSGKSFEKSHIESDCGFVLDVVKGDLFSSGPDVSLAHCVSKDFRLGKGIAKIFREKFGRIDELKKSRADVGGLAVLKVGKRFIYNLVTKEKYSDLPDYETLRLSLEEMKMHAVRNKVREIAMPKIGCGLDGLQWNAVRTLVKNVFLRENISIKVYFLDGSSDETKTTPKKASRGEVKTPKKESKAEVKTPKKESPGQKKVRTPKNEVDQSPAKDSKQPSVVDLFKRNAGHKRESAEKGDSLKVPRKVPKLLDIFNRWKVVFVGEVEPKLARYVIAYGGEVLQDFKASDATHIIYESRLCDRLGTAGKSAGHFVSEFLEDSIKLGEVQDSVKYEL